MTALIARDGGLAGQRFELELEGERTIGREGADITVDDDQVSRRHARVTVRDGAVAVEDLGSTNGTWVNGARIEARTTLAAGDSVRIGATTFELEAAPRPVTAEAPAAETPAAETPAAETPAAETPAAETPAAETPASETPAPATPAPSLVTAAVAAPHEPFGTYLAPESSRHGGGIQSRQRGPILLTYAIVLGVAVALAIYFGLA